jgi:UbiD family decarboxylase
MANPGLGNYLNSLDSERIIWIDDTVPRDFVITALCTELDKRKLYPLLCFEKVEGCEMPIVTNLFAKRERILEMMGTSEAEFSKTWLKAEENKIKPKIVSQGKVQEVIQIGDEIDVRTLPIMQHFKSDAGRYITGAFVVAKDPGTGVRNLSFHRMQVKTSNKMGISLHSRQHLWNYFCVAEKQNRPLEIAAVIGAHPLVVLAASAKTSIEVDEYDIAGGLLKQPLELVRGQTVDVEYPADAEIVLEGRILTNVYEDEGPFGEYTGYSTSRSTRNVFEITALCRRENPYYLSILPGPSADHLNLMRVAKEALVWDRLKERVPNVHRVHYYKSGVNFHCAVSIEPGAEGSVRQALMLLFGLDPYLKLAVAVDQDIDITDEAAVMWALATRMQGDQDIFIVPKVFTNRLDPSSSGGMGAKVGIDATTKPGSDAIVLELDREHVSEASRIMKRLLSDL